MKSLTRTAALVLCVMCAGGIPAQEAFREEPAALSPELQDLAREISALQHKLDRLDDENAIENLQRIFGFYIDKNMWTQAADLFAPDATLEIGGEGVYRGPGRILEYFKQKGAEGPQFGILNDHMQLQPIIHVREDGREALGRWHHFSQEAVHGESHHWGTGVYENVYVKRPNGWQIQSLHLYSTMRTPYDGGWGVTALPRSAPSDALPPDAAPTVEYENYPAVFVPPFHYGNPVTGNMSNTAIAVMDDLPFASLDEMEAHAGAMERQVGLLEDADAVERLHTIYGYYLARNQWDDLAGIFAEDGTIEIALRGVYEGRASVRRNLDLYGVQGELPGQLHNHMQFQPVIHVAPDGQSALMRSRAFSMMGAYQGAGRWMGGIYENLFVKREGVWQFQKDQVFNTYFADYDLGWKDLVWRPAPGITESNPPDAPPTVHFEMYPRPFLPPYHYDNPVTGRDSHFPLQ